MSLNINITDTSSKVSAKVTSRGQLITSPLDFSNSVFLSLIVDNTADTWFKPLAGQRLVITDIIVQTNRDTAVGGTIVDIYEATAEDSATIDKSLFQFDMTRQQTISLIGLNLIVNEGLFLNAKASDSNILLTICGYFVET